MKQPIKIFNVIITEEKGETQTLRFWLEAIGLGLLLFTLGVFGFFAFIHTILFFS